MCQTCCQPLHLPACWVGAGALAPACQPLLRLVCPTAQGWGDDGWNATADSGAKVPLIGSAEVRCHAPAQACSRPEPPAVGCTAPQRAPPACVDLSALLVCLQAARRMEGFGSSGGFGSGGPRSARASARASAGASPTSALLRCLRSRTVRACGPAIACSVPSQLAGTCRLHAHHHPNLPAPFLYCCCWPPPSAGRTCIPRGPTRCRCPTGCPHPHLPPNRARCCWCCWWRSAFWASPCLAAAGGPVSSTPPICRAIPPAA